MVQFKDARLSTTITMPAPEIVGLLPDVAGGETNLLPEALTHADLKVWFTVPALSNPDLAEETVELIVDGTVLPEATRRWNTPIDDTDRYLELPQVWLRNNDGEHRLEYKVTIYNGETEDSFELVMTLDTRAPLLTASNELVFPAPVLHPNKLTAHYLSQNSDQVTAALPAYTTPQPWDRITWYWGPTPGNLEVGGVIELDDKNYADPVVVTIAGELIRDRGDGWRYVWYRVQDRAGNESQRSEPVELDVAATPIPRKLPWPTVEKAVGENEMQTLDPLLANNGVGVVVEVPQDAVVYPEEQVWVQWGVPGTLGAARVKLPIPGQRRYQIEMKSVAAHIGKSLPVSYIVVDDKEQEHPSTPRQLTVQTIPSNRLKAVKCDGLTGGTLSYKEVAQQGARLTLDVWPLMTTDHWIMIRMTGLDAAGRETVYDAVEKRAVTTPEVFGGIGGSTEVRVSKVFLNTLRRNGPLTGKVYVSFDGGQTWPHVNAPNFPSLYLTFVD